MIEKLKSKYPFLYKHLDYIDCDEGWFDLIDELSSKLEPMIQSIKDEIDNIPYSELNDIPYASQVKEKFGGLRFYMSTETNEMSKIIHDYEQWSLRTCERCGKEGKVKVIRGWVTTLCEEHS